jgi:hypothetical protein
LAVLSSAAVLAGEISGVRARDRMSMAAAAWLESVGPITTSALAAASFLGLPGRILPGFGGKELHRLAFMAAGGVDLLHGELGGRQLGAFRKALSPVLSRISPTLRVPSPDASTGSTRALPVDPEQAVRAR